MEEKEIENNEVGEVVPQDIIDKLQALLVDFSIENKINVKPVLVHAKDGLLRFDLSLGFKGYDQIIKETLISNESHAHLLNKDFVFNEARYRIVGWDERFSETPVIATGDRTYKCFSFREAEYLISRQKKRLLGN